MKTNQTPLTPHRPAARHRIGFTLVELLVVIAIIGMLMALIIPAVGAARATARNAECINALKQIGLGLIAYDTAKQNFPGYVQSVERSGGTGQQYAAIQANGLSNSGFINTNNPDQSLISWASMILPQMEGNEIYDILVNADATGPRAAIRPFASYICPDDTEVSSLPDNAGISYSANCGTWDWYTTSGSYVNANNFNRATYNAIPGDTKHNGVFHNRTFGKTKVSLVDLDDGASNTILVTENVTKEVEPGAALYTWAGVRGLDPSAAGEQQLGVVWLDPAQFAPGSSNPLTESPFSEANGPAMANFSSEPDVTPTSVDLFDQTQPFFARPASNHPSGTFNTVFGDGHVQSLSADLDYTVYVRLMTPKGSKSVEPVANQPSAYRNLAPLANGDF